MYSHDVSLFDAGEEDGDEQEREGQVQQEGLDQRLRAVHFRIELGHTLYLEHEIGKLPNGRAATKEKHFLI